MPPDREQQPRATANRLLAPAIFALLVLATMAAFAAAQRLKREPLILDKVTFGPVVKGEPVFTPNGDGRADLARIEFRLTRSDRGTVQLIDRDERAVRTFTVEVLNNRGRVAQSVAPGALLPAYKPIVFRWNGRNASGRLASTGPYRLRVELLDEDRNLIPGGRIRLHSLRRISGSSGP